MTTYLSFEVVGLLREVFLAEMLGIVAAAVSPFEHVGSGHVCVLEVMFGVVVPAGSSLGQIERTRTLGVGIGHGRGDKSKGSQNLRSTPKF